MLMILQVKGLRNRAFQRFQILRHWLKGSIMCPVDVHLVPLIITSMLVILQVKALCDREF